MQLLMWLKLSLTCPRAPFRTVKFSGKHSAACQRCPSVVSCLSFNALSLWKYRLSSEARKELFALLFLKKTNAASHCLTLFGAWRTYDFGILVIL